MPTMSSQCFSVVLAATAAVAACAGPPDARRQWADGMSTLGITPTYPMREDIQVGDIALMIPSACDVPGSDNQTLTVMIGSLDPRQVHAAISDHYAQRYVLPATVGERVRPVDPAPPAERAAPAGAPASPGAPAAAKPPVPAMFTQPLAPRGLPILPVGREARPLDRPRLAAFPGVEYRSFASGDLSAGAAAGGGLGRLFGINAEAERVLSVQVIDVEELRIPAGAMADLANAAARDANGPVSAGRLALLLPAMRAPTHRDCVPVLTFISRVFYARAVQITASRGTSLAAALSLALQRQQTIARRGPLPTDTPQPPAPGAEATQEQELDAAVSALVTGLTGATPGIGTSIGIAENGSIGLRQNFERPLAFGTDNAITVTLRSVAEAQLAAAAPQRVTWSDSAPLRLIQTEPPPAVVNTEPCALLRRLNPQATCNVTSGYVILQTGPLPPGSTMRPSADGVFRPDSATSRLAPSLGR
jgi:hypothetical protein